MGTIEDERAAASLAAGLSGQIGAASLAMLSVLGAVLLFVLDKRHPTLMGMSCVAASFVCFIVSIAAGARAVASIYRKGHTGNWNYLAGDRPFQVQAIFAILGLVLFPAGVAWMGPPTTDVEMGRLRAQIDSATLVVNRLDSTQQSLRVIIECLRRDSGGGRRTKTQRC